MKKRTLTLIEIMIVIFLITLITGAIGYNLKGSMEKGKIFKTKQARQQLYDLLMVCIDEGKSVDEVIKNPEKCLTESGLAKDPTSLVKDGWNQRFEIKAKGKNDIIVTSPNLPEK